MTLEQATAFGIILVTVGLFIWGRLPYDLVALLALFAGLVTGVVPADNAFTGFSDDIVIIVAAALLISAAISQSGFIETLVRPLLPFLRSEQTQVPALAAAVAILSAFSKNIGALAIFMPVAIQLARRTGTSASRLLMPMAFASLVGGIITLVGTSPNIIVSKVRADIKGEPFGMFDYAPVGISITILGLIFLAIGYRLLPQGRKAAASMDAAFNIEHYTTEARVSDGSPIVGRTVAHLQSLGDGQIAVGMVIRERFRRYAPVPDRVLCAGDVVLLEGEPEDLERLIARAGLEFFGDREKHPTVRMNVVEGVITPDSLLIGRTPSQVGLGSRHHTTLLAVSRSGQRIQQRLDAIRFRSGDVVVLKGEAASLPETLGTLKVLPLAERTMPLGDTRRSYVPIGVLLVVMVLLAFHVVPVAVAFFGAAVVLLVFRVMTMDEAYKTVEWQLLVLLGALIPVTDAIRTTGGADLIAGWLTPLMHAMPPMGALALTVVIAMAVTPFLNNAATVLMMAPIAASLAGRLQLNVDPFLMAVALGAACDFLTPIGHQCNTLVMGPGGYRFGDYWRLGLPLSIIVVAAGVPLIALFWPLTSTG